MSGWNSLTTLARSGDLQKRFDTYRSLAEAYGSSTVRSYRQRTSFEHVDNYVMFIGHARSGHTLVGALLTAHPDMVISHELDALRYVRFGFRRNQLYHLHLQRDAAFARELRVEGSRRYNYAVPGEWQGKFRKLRVIGDKKGGASTRKAGEHPELIERLRRTVGVPVRFIHVTRNPYDNISTIALRSGRSLEEAADRYFERCQTVQRIRQDTDPSDVLEVRHDDFVGDPTSVLEGLCQSLGVDADPGYLSHCAEIVYTTPHRSRSDSPWTGELVARVGDRMASYPFLDGYTFE